MFYYLVKIIINSYLLESCMEKFNPLEIRDYENPESSDCGKQLFDEVRPEDTEVRGNSGARPSTVFIRELPGIAILPEGE
jgi:hypothetical protein